MSPRRPSARLCPCQWRATLRLDRRQAYGAPTWVQRRLPFQKCALKSSRRSFIALCVSTPARTARNGGSTRRERSIAFARARSEEHTSELQSRLHLVCRLLLEKKKKKAILESIDIS